VRTASCATHSGSTARTAALPHSAVVARLLGRRPASSFRVLVSRRRRGRGGVAVANRGPFNTPSQLPARKTPLRRGNMRVQSESRAQSRRLAATPAMFAPGEGARARLSKATEDTGEQSPRLDSSAVIRHAASDGIAVRAGLGRQRRGGNLAGLRQRESGFSPALHRRSWLVARH
jgi:hypothetical protein